MLRAARRTAETSGLVSSKRDNSPAHQRLTRTSALIAQSVGADSRGPLGRHRVMMGESAYRELGARAPRCRRPLSGSPASFHRGMGDPMGQQQPDFLVFAKLSQQLLAESTDRTLQM